VASYPLNALFWNFVLLQPSSTTYISTVEPRYFELSGETINSLKKREFEIEEGKFKGSGFELEITGNSK